MGIGFHFPCGKCTEDNAWPLELHIRQDPTLAQRHAEREKVLAAAIAANPSSST